MQRTFAVIVAALALGPAAAAATCPRPAKAIARPAMLGPFPTPRGYTYTSARRVKGVTVVSGWSSGKLDALRLLWFNTVAGAGRWKAVDKGVHDGVDVIAFKGFAPDQTAGSVTIVPTCATRGTVTIRVRFG
jgi:hypothetical protein